MVFGPLSSFGPWENEYMEIFSSAPDSFRLSGIHSRQEKVNKLYAQNPNEIFLCSYPSLISLKNEIINFFKGITQW